MPYQIVRERCLCCHNCALECPVGAIQYRGTGYVVDPERCVECGTCARVCNVEAAVEVAASQRNGVHPRLELQAEGVVLGAGASGIVAAARLAKRSGKKVIVLEKAAKYGGSGWFAGFHVPLQDSQRPVEFTQRQRELLDYGADPEVLKMAQRAPGEFFQWFRTVDPRVDALWQPVQGPGGRKSMDLPRRVYFNTKNQDRAIGPGRSTSVMERILTDHFQELGITVLYRHEALSLERDARGAISGVLARDPGGEVHITCRAVISCTGGFANNPQMLRRYAPHFYGPQGSEATHRFAAPTNTGDVVRLGRSIGAFLDEKNFSANVFGPVHHPFGFGLFQMANQGEMVNVNLYGERFYNEGVLGGGAAAMCHQPRRIAWSILDQNTRLELTRRLSAGEDGIAAAELDAEFEAEARLDTPLKVADSLEELAEQTGVDRERFLATIARYNQFCHEGRDRAFGKAPGLLRPVETPPFYGIYGKMACDGAFGGMLVNARTEVFGADKTEVIPGLFAAGDNASGWSFKSREAGDHRLMATNECNWAVGSGFVAGTAAADYLARQEGQ